MKLSFLTNGCQKRCEIAIQHLGGPSAKVGSSAKLCVPVFKASLLNYLGFHLPKCVCLPSVVYWQSRHLHSMQGGSIGPSRFICQVWCAGIQGIYAINSPSWGGGPSAKVCSSAKFCVLVFKTNIICQS